MERICNTNSSSFHFIAAPLKQLIQLCTPVNEVELELTRGFLLSVLESPAELQKCFLAQNKEISNRKQSFWASPLLSSLLMKHLMKCEVVWRAVGRRTAKWDNGERGGDCVQGTSFGMMVKTNSRMGTSEEQGPASRRQENSLWEGSVKSSEMWARQSQIRSE